MPALTDSDECDVVTLVTPHAVTTSERLLEVAELDCGLVSVAVTVKG